MSNLPKTSYETTSNNLRSPGGYHEWLPVSQAPKFKEWGITAKQIKTWRTKTSDVKFINPVGGHAGRVGYYAHRDIIALVEQAGSFSEFKNLLHEWAKIRLPNGIKDLPIGLQ